MSAPYIPPGSRPAPEPDRPRARAPQDTALPILDDEDEVNLVVTFFTDYAATTKREEHLTPEALADLIRTTSAADKASLPWLKLARFGITRTEKGSFRHNANVVAVTGLEADYDLERISFDEAEETLTKAGIQAILYTSPSHDEDRPRWRVLCPLSQEYPPAERARFLARLNGLFGGIFSRESWVGWQSYYFGAVNANPSHQVAVLDGRYIDQAAELDASAIGRPQKPKPPAGNGDADPAAFTDKRIAGIIEALLDNIRAAPDGAKHHTLLANARSMGGYLHLTGWSEAEAVEALVAALPSADDWELAQRTALAGLQHGKLSPLTLAERPYRGFAAATPPPQMQPEAESEPKAEPPFPPGEPEPDAGWEEQHPPPDDAADALHNKLITEQSVVRAFVAKYRDDLRFNHSSNSWLVWSEHYWKPDQRKLAFAWALKLCEQLAATIGAKGRLVVEKIRFSAAVEQGARAMTPLSTAQEDWDADLWRMGTPGGVVDLKTGILRQGERSDMITKTTGCTPAASADCPLWLKFLDDALGGDTPMIGFLQRYFGYCLTGLTMEEIIVFLFGPGGAGKGTVVKTITGIMGDYAITAPMELFTAQAYRPTEYYRADMAGKRLIVAAETEQGTYWAEAFVKEITGGDRLSGRHPGGRPFSFDPTHKPLLHGNHMPKLRGRSTAMERRLRIALFNNKPAVPDLELKEKLRAEWPGILRWMINGCLDWQRSGLQPPDAVADANKRYFDAQDIIGRWIEDCCILDKNLQETSATLRHSFNRWARTNDEEEMNGNAFAETLNLFEGAPLKRVKDRDGKRWIRGIGLQVTPEQQSQHRARHPDDLG